jgi:hypothetical protein
MSEQVALQKHFGHVAGAVVRQTGGDKEGLSETQKVSGVELRTDSMC